MMNTAVPRTPAAAAAENEALRKELDEARRALLHSSGGGSSPAAEVPGRALFPLESSPTSPTSIAEVNRVENEDFTNKCISTITFQKQITAVTISASALAEMRSNLTMLINNFDNTMSKAEMKQILVSAMNVPGSAGKTKFNIPGKAVVDDNVAPELAVTLARAMINEINGSAKDKSMDALNQMSKSDEGINTIIEATKDMVSEVWLPVMRTLALALAQADDDKMKRMGSSLSKDVVKMHSSSNKTNLLMKTTEAIAKVIKPYQMGSYARERTEYEDKLPKDVMDVDFEKVLALYNQFLSLEEARTESERAKENPLPLPPSPKGVLANLASAKSSNSLIRTLQKQISEFVEDTDGQSFVEMEGIAIGYSANKAEMMARHHDDQRSIANVNNTTRVLNVTSFEASSTPRVGETEGDASAMVTPKNDKGRKVQLSTILPTLSADEQRIKAEAKAEGKCVSYNLGRMKSQAHEAGTARCTNDREKLRKGGIRLADTCPKCSKGTSQLVKSLEAADK